MTEEVVPDSLTFPIVAPDDLKQVRELTRLSGVAQRSYAAAELARQRYLDELRSAHSDWPDVFTVDLKTGRVSAV